MAYWDTNPGRSALASCLISADNNSDDADRRLLAHVTVLADDDRPPPTGGMAGQRSCGRPRLVPGRGWVDVSRDGALVLSVAAPFPVAVGLHRPGPVDTVTLATLARRERDVVARFPAHRRPELAGRIWVRKDAALRLLGRGPLFAPLIEVCQHEGSTTLQVPGEDGGPDTTVHVHEVPVPGGACAAVATRQAGCSVLLGTTVHEAGDPPLRQHHDRPHVGQPGRLG